MKKIINLFIILSTLQIVGQSTWKKLNFKSDSARNRISKHKKAPRKYQGYYLNTKEFKALLNTKGRNHTKIIELPTNNGNLEQFSVVENSYLHPNLSKKFPEIQSFTAKSIKNKGVTATISSGNDGIHVMIHTPQKRTLYIDPVSETTNHFIAYNKQDLEASPFTCNNLENKHEARIPEQELKLRSESIANELISFRIAISCTNEYSEFHLKEQGVSLTADERTKKAAVLSAVNTSLTRLNSIYEKELAVRLVLVENNDKIIFVDSRFDDGLSNGDASTLLGENQIVIDKNIGNSNYDIGHVFSISLGAGDGVAYTGIVCDNSLKAQGVTGSKTPINDAYDIDYVAHEIGHQFSANHTFNGDTGSCGGGNRNNTTSYEPGSGTTIMGYAGICAPLNVQQNTSPYFHAVSINQIKTFINKYASCGQVLNVGNTSPSVDAGADYSIPKSTPFALKGNAIDNEDSNLTYCWEQMDNEIAVQPPVSTSIGGPLFRSKNPVNSPIRYFPSLSTVVAGKTESTWEVLPSVARELNFALTVRDNNAKAGATGRDDMKVNVVNTQPFTVTSQTISTVWQVGSKQKISWNVGSTNQSPINCSMVNIKLSVDGGNSFPITLAEDIPNDGNHEVIIPNNITSNARILVEAADNIFFNINKGTIEIDNSKTAFFVYQPEQQETCNTSNKEINYILKTEFFNNFNENVSFKANNLPGNTIAKFTPESLNSNGEVTLTLSNYNGNLARLYDIEVLASSNSITSKTFIKLNLLDANFNETSLTSPENNSLDNSILPNFTWTKNDKATSYILEVATDYNFNNIIISTNTTNNYFTVTEQLNTSTQYFWRIQPKNSCGSGEFSSISSFTTSDGNYCPSYFEYDFIGEYISKVSFNTIENSSTKSTSKGYEDFTNISTTVKKNNTYTINVDLHTEYQHHCYVFIDWNKDFKFSIDERYDLGEHYFQTQTNSGIIKNSEGKLSKNIVIPENAKTGKTLMRVVIEIINNDIYGKGACDSDHLTEYGETEDYTIEITEATSSIADIINDNSLKIYPNPSYGKINIDLSNIQPGEIQLNLYNLIGQLIDSKTFNNTNTNFKTSIEYKNISSGAYILKINNNKQTLSKKILFK